MNDKLLKKESPADSDESQDLFDEAEGMLGELQEEELEEEFRDIIDALPTPEKKKDAQMIFQRLAVSLVKQSNEREINPEVMKIIADSNNKDNEYRYKFSVKQQENEAEARLRKDKLEDKKHDNFFSIIKPTIFVVLAIVVSMLAVSVAFILNGQEGIGVNLLIGLFSAIFGFLAGFGVSKVIKKEED